MMKRCNVNPSLRPLEHDNIVTRSYFACSSLWTQGCPTIAPVAKNPETWDFNGGMLVDIEEIKERLREFPGQSGITFVEASLSSSPSPARKSPIGAAANSVECLVILGFYL